MRDIFPGSFEINYDRGYMIIYYSTFFPAAKTRLNKLFKVIALDYEHEKAILTELSKYLEYNVTRTELDKKPLVNEAYDKKQLVSDLQRRLKERKFPNGVPLTKDEIENLRKRDLPNARRNVTAALRRAGQNMRDNRGYVDNLILVKKRLEAIR